MIIYKVYEQFFKSIIYFILLLILKIIYPLIKIRFQEIETKNIGHYSKSIEIFLCEEELKIYKKNKLDFWIRSKTIANKFLLKKWNEQLYILPSLFFLDFLKFLKKKNIKKFIIPYRHPDNYKNNDWEYNTKEKFKNLKMWNYYDNNFVLNRTKPRIFFSNNEVKNFQKKLDLFFKNVNHKKIILFYARDSLYRENQHRTQKENMCWRNSKINTYMDAMNEMTKLSYLTVRMGKFLINKILYDKNKFIFDYPFSKISSESLDIFFCHACSFGIFDSGGFNSVPSLFRKPISLVNITHKREIKNRNDSTSPLIIFKKIFSRKLNRQISFSEYEKLNIFKFQKDSDFKENHLEIIDNTSEEIKEITVESELKFGSKNYKPDEESIFLQRKAKKILCGLSYGNLEYIDIGAHFLKNNKELLII